MPIQKDLKRLVRSRMKKTGEAYTAARLQVLRRREPTVNYADAAGLSDAVVNEKTGRTWDVVERMRSLLRGRIENDGNRRRLRARAQTGH